MPYNPYNPYSYNPYLNFNYQQPNNYNAYQQPQSIQQQNYHPLTFVNGIEGAKSFIVNPNQVVYLKDSDSDLFFEKRADAQGKYTLTAFHLVPINNENQDKGKNIDLSNYATKNDLNSMSNKLNEKINELNNQLEMLLNKKEE